MIIKKGPILFILFLMLTCSNIVQGQVLNKQKMLDKFHFWHNKDWTWYKENIPFLKVLIAQLMKPIITVGN